MESCMKPIAKAIALACCAVVTMTAAKAAPGGNASPRVEGPRDIVPTGSGFVIRASIPEHGDDTSNRSAPPKTIRIGTGVHLDARLLLRPASSIKENSHARR